MPAVIVNRKMLMSLWVGMFCFGVNCFSQKGAGKQSPFFTVGKVPGGGIMWLLTGTIQFCLTRK